MSTPWPGSMCTNGAESQNSSGPGSPVFSTPPVPVAAPVAWPTKGACRLRLLHAWSAIRGVVANGAPASDHGAQGRQQQHEPDGSVRRYPDRCIKPAAWRGLVRLTSLNWLAGFNFP